jgi:hypothetical protein
MKIFLILSAVLAFLGAIAANPSNSNGEHEN